MLLSWMSRRLLVQSDIIVYSISNTTLNSKTGSSRDTHSKQTGINRESICNELQYFSAASGALVPDVMHDVLEGVLQYEVMLLLRHLIYDESCFTLDQLNSRISRMELGINQSSIRDKCSNSSITRQKSPDTKW